MNHKTLSLMAGCCIAGAALAQADLPATTLRPSTSGNLKDLQIRGRIQAQFGYTNVDNDEGDGDFSTFEMRRVRLGLRGTLFDNVRAQLEANLVPGEDLSMRSAFLQWREHEPAYIKLGMDKPLFGFEETTSSAEILTVERTLINNILAPGTQTGLSLEGEMDRLSYGAGVYTDQANRNEDRQDRYMMNASVGLKLDGLVEDVTLRLRGDYIASDDRNGQFGGGFEDGIAASLHLAVGTFDIRAEYMMGDNDGDKVSGWYVTPSLFLTDSLQLVGRYEQADSDKQHGIRAPSRYARRADHVRVRETKDANDAVISKVDPQRGDSYQAAYVGLNYYLRNHAHKLMSGVEFAQLDNTDAGTLDAITVYGAWRMLY